MTSQSSRLFLIANAASEVPSTHATLTVDNIEPLQLAPLDVSSYTSSVLSGIAAGSFVVRGALVVAEVSTVVRGDVVYVDS